MEAIQLLFTKAQISSVKNIIKQRTVLNLNDNSFYVSFINMFNVNNRDSLFEFDLYAESDKGPIQFEIRGHEKDTRWRGCSSNVADVCSAEIDI